MKKFFTLALLAITLISTAQESTLLRVNYKKGEAYTVAMDITQNMGTLSSMDMTMLADVAVTDVEGDVYSSEMKFTKIAMNMLSGGNLMSFDSDKSDDELDETGKMMKAQMGPMLKMVFFSKGNSLGKVLELKIEPDLPGASDMAKQFSGVIYPKEAVKVGSTWNLVKEEKGMKMGFVYAVKSISKDKVLLAVSGNISGMGEGTILGNMTIDRASGIALKSKIDMTMSISGQEVESTVNIAMKKQ
ncbi:MAG: DUF6263 family protein [Polaribacter sp.]|nr:DUF6263 family protein [Polaribacter sp.]